MHGPEDCAVLMMFQLAQYKDSEPSLHANQCVSADDSKRQDVRKACGYTALERKLPEHL